MKFDWTSIIDRKGHDAIALEAIGAESSPYPAPKEGFDPIPMWVADMNFATCPAIQKAVIERTNHPCFGYFRPRQEYYDSVIAWHKDRYGVTDLEKDHIGYANGVLGGVVTALNIFCSKGGSVLVHKPTYVGFTGVLKNNGYDVIHSELKQDEKGVYRMDFEEMEKLIKEKNIHCTIFCSPHNPCGRVWEKWELEKAMALFEKYDVKVIVDEIWADIITEGYTHIPAHTVSDFAKNNTVTMYAPSKTFNLAGLVGSYSVIYNKYIRDRYNKEQSLSHFNSMNVLSMYAQIGAYSAEGREWVDELRQTITGNIDFAVDYINKHFDGVKVTRPEGTYMLFLDCNEWCDKHGKTCDELLKACWDVGCVVQDGRAFHGSCHLRINLASPLSRIKEAFERMDKYVFNA